MKYTVITAVSIRELAELVEQKIRDGWMPQGGVAAVDPNPDSENLMFLQAMTKNEGASR